MQKIVNLLCGSVENQNKAENQNTNLNQCQPQKYQDITQDQDKIEQEQKQFFSLNANSSLNFQNIIKNKKEGLQLTGEEIQYWVNGVVEKSIPEYQTAALLMAIFFQGMNVEERSELTKAMAQSGQFLNFKKFNKLKVDKHSTGGVGDKTSLIISPLVVCLGFLNPMVSGRGLGHTGGTVDKLESIPNYVTSIDFTEMEKSIEKVGCFIAGQTQDLAPADKIIYSLRDVTQTVNEISLITSSILSKKFACDLTTLTLDVKCGSGAFMTNFQQAVELGCSLVQTANKGNVQCNGVITRMDYPLGLWQGNSCEVYEVYQSLMPGSKYTNIVKNRIIFNDSVPGFIQIGKDNKVENCLESLVFVTFGLLLNMLILAGKNPKESYILIQNAWISGNAFEQFKRWIQNQQGDLDKFLKNNQIILDNMENDDDTENVIVFRSPVDGKIESLDGQQIGYLLVELGAGRKVKSDEVNPLVSMQWKAYPNQVLKKGDIIAKIYHPNAEILKKVNVKQWLTNNIKFTENLDFEDKDPFIYYIIKNETTPEEATKFQQLNYPHLSQN